MIANRAKSFAITYVPVTPTPIADPVYVAHSRQFFKELGLSDVLATSEPFMRMFGGDLTGRPRLCVFTDR